MLDWFFDTLGPTWGVLALLGAGILLFLIVAIVLELRTKTIFPERAKKDDDDGFLDFGDDE